MVFGIFAIFALWLIYWTGISACLYYLTAEKTPAKARLFAMTCEVVGPLAYRMATILALLLMMGVLPSWLSVASACIGALVSLAFVELGCREVYHLNKNGGNCKHDKMASYKVCLVGGGFFLLSVISLFVGVGWNF